MTDDALVALSFGFIILAIAALVAWFLALRFRRREMQHREWMAALEKGMPLPALNGLESVMGGPSTYLLKGLIWLACGLTLTVFLVGLWWTTTARQPSLEAQIRQAQQLKEVGYSLEEIREIVRVIRVNYPLDATRGGGAVFPLGLSLMGLVPAGVGVAYLVFYRLEGRRAQ